MRLVIGTAGHIDHGKTSLTRALTGIDTDRLKEEKARGITIELGFAHMDLGGETVGVVDVPGHERFIRAMVAGAVGIDLVILVVAADEGVMPQTREHLDVCGLLGVARGVIALSKADAASPELIELATADVRAHVAGSFLAEAAIIPCSALTGAGLPELRAELARLARAVPARDAAGLFRLPLDRVFTMKGFGTVVTGTVAGGTARVGDELVVLPVGRRAKVRGVQVHGAAVEAAQAGQRAALNLGGVAREEVARGDVLAHEGTLAPAQVLDVRLRLLAACARALPSRARVLVHVGTTQVTGTCVLAAGGELLPGQAAAAQLRLERPVVVMPKDRFIVRGFTVQRNHGTTMGGGEIVRVTPPKLRTRRTGPEAAAGIERFASASTQARVALEVRARGRAGAGAGELPGRVGASPVAVKTALSALVRAGELLAAGELLVHREVFEELGAAAAVLVRGHHAEAPDQPGISREELRARLQLDPRLFDALVADAVAHGVLTTDRDLVALRARAPAAAASPAADQLCAVLETAGLSPPRVDELPGSAAERQRALEGLVRAGRVVKVKDLYFAAAALADLRTRLRAFLVTRGQITPQEWKDLTGTTRKYSIPLAEHFDAEKLTLRVGDLRKLRG